jgi:predicted ATPase
MRAVETLSRCLSGRGVLLVIDNCDHVVEACAQLATALLSTCADVRILATSGESLGVTGETVWRLDALGADDASRLYLERAKQRRPDLFPVSKPTERSPTSASVSTACRSPSNSQVTSRSVV